MTQYIIDIKTPAQKEAGAVKSEYGLDNHGFTNLHNVYWNLPSEALYEEAIFRGEGKVTHGGALTVSTGKHTARSANDKFVVREPSTEDRIWWGEYNRPFSLDKFHLVWNRLQGFLQGRDLFVQDCYCGADKNYRLPIRVITEYAWHSLFARNMFIEPATNDELRRFVPEFTIVSIPSFKGLPQIDGTLSETFILLNFDEKLCLIGNSGYGGEIKKSAFTVMNFLLPLEGVLSMHCSANVGDDGASALFFGLSGTGKTTLSADPKRGLIGDDEHGWSDEGIFNFEGGCYAKVIALSPTAEPQIYACTRKFGTILENVAFDTVSRLLDLDDERLTENTRAAYPLEYIDNAVPDKQAGHPKNIVMLTCDASGVMPPIARLTPEQAMYHFISGYTSKVAGTEVDLGKEPEITFSACFGAPFMVHHPAFYADMLRNKMLKYGATCWLVNTGWTGGPYGIGKRISIHHTRTLLNAALDGTLSQVEYRTDPVFGFQVPKSCPGVPDKVLRPIEGWEDPKAYEDKYLQLAALFIENFKKFADGTPPEVVKAGPTKEGISALRGA
ncbi:MAG TPA: phosphoenolpyruvate carboxykinase (ATP) [candidate division Zixibacteria bacterium]|nr:phosphoenolpyruvate carboxykinase (ATP) [candidate division Zixibacteria bacterium]MDD4918560.1 phosphoenolpyruvate carboxykinase (ATP) [candidate division Zixibacteria bacterium]MDM7971953.1 phosphoenolpyruvate carboxykinase (ATP) [candidate division Zixibacteria bacterium]HOD65620.1 phosphoenolpyruvate carboxykinase (ATP) [candidate division Zixibacteria bacterium]HOZ08198.1 phosphoenolpyruvate carboxykinase (ATP) [candidate division Zixibacteria bacterium]